SGALGWNGFMTFGMIYWLAPRMFQTTELYSKKLAETHFWVGTLGILLYIVAIHVAGVTQGLTLRAFGESGRHAYPTSAVTANEIIPMYWVRLVGGLMFFSGMLMCAYNVFMTRRMRPAKYEDPVHEAAALAPEREEPAPRPAL